MISLYTSSTRGPDADYYIGIFSSASQIVALKEPIKLGTELAEEFRLWVQLGEGRPSWDTGNYGPDSEGEKDVVRWALKQQTKFEFTGAIIFGLNCYQNFAELYYPLATGSQDKFKTGPLFPPKMFAAAQTKRNNPQQYTR